jgi:hypothetical protein
VVNIVEFPSKPSIIFSNHETPFREIISKMKTQRKSSGEIEQAIISKIASSEGSFVILATISGKWTKGRDFATIAKAAGGILHKSSPIIEALEIESKWTRVLCETLEDKRRLLGAKIVWVRDAKAFVTFMKPRVRPYTTKYIEVKGLTSPEAWKEVKDALTNSSGGSVSSISPAKFIQNYAERIIWAVEHKEDSGWTFPPYVQIANGSSTKIAWAPICMYCAGEDHHYAQCKMVEILGEKPVIGIDYPTTKFRNLRVGEEPTSEFGPSLVPGAGSSPAVNAVAGPSASGGNPKEILSRKDKRHKGGKRGGR